MMNPVIEYQGKHIRVTPDTAAELVFTGEAELVSGDLPVWPPVVVESKPEEKPEKRTYKKRAK